MASLLIFSQNLWPFSSICYGGEFARARTHWEKTEALYSPGQHAALSTLYGADLGVTCKAYLALALCFLGYPQQATIKAQEAITLAQSLAHPASLASALFFAALGHQYRREEHLLQERSAELIALCEEYGFRHWLAHAMIIQGWVLVHQGRIEQIEQGLAALRTLGSRVGVSSQFGLQADAYGKVGQPEKGLQVLAEGLTFVQESGEQAFASELHRLKGQLVLQSGVRRPRPKLVRRPRSKVQNRKFLAPSL